MSSEPTQKPDSPPATQKQPRNPVERILVWGLIVVLLAVVGTEAMARFSYTRSLNSLEAALARDEEGETLKLDDVSSHVSGFYSRQDDEQQRVVTYTWNGLLKTYGSIKLPYTHEREVLGLETADAPPEELPVAVAPFDEESAADGPNSGGGGGGPHDAASGRPGGPGGGRGGGGFDPMQFDTDGDGKISLEEAPERLRENFAEADTNDDSYIDEAEFEARIAAVRALGGGFSGRGGDDGGRPDRPQRPAIGGADENAPSSDETAEESPAEAPSAESAPETEESDSNQ